VLKVLVLPKEEIIIHPVRSHLIILYLRTAIFIASSLSVHARSGEGELKFLSSLPFRVRVHVRCFKLAQINLVAGLVHENRIDEGQ